jgi:hypothetical protein
MILIGYCVFLSWIFLKIKAAVQDGAEAEVPDSAGEEVRAGEQAGDQPSAGAEVPGQAGGRLRLCRRPQVHHRPGQSGEKGNFCENYEEDAKL